MLKKVLSQLACEIIDDGSITFRDRFEQQRRNIGKAFSLANEIREISKRGIKMLAQATEGNGYEIATVEAEMKERWRELRGLDLPGDLAWRHDTEAGQEMFEFIVVARLFPNVVSEVNAEVMITGSEIPSAEMLDMPPQTWLAGLGDAPGEMMKLLEDRLCRADLSAGTRFQYRKNLLCIATEIYEFLSDYETCYEMVINNSRRRGYGNTFRGMLGRVRGVIRRVQESVIKRMDRLAEKADRAR